MNSQNNTERNNWTIKQDGLQNIAYPKGVDNTLQLLRNNGADNNLHEENSIYSICQNRHDSDEQLSLISSANFNLCSTHGFSPSSVASDHVQESNVQLIIENSANVNLFEKNGGNALHVACMVGHDSIVQRLLKNGADVNLCDSKGFSPLAIASGNGHDSTVHLLI